MRRPRAFTLIELLVVVDMQTSMNTTATAVVIPFLICPSEVKSAARQTTDGLTYGIASYAYCGGDWFVWAGLGGSMRNRTAFGVNQSRSLAEFADGTSNTLLMSEGKAFLTYYRDRPTLSRVNDPNNIPRPGRRGSSRASTTPASRPPGRPTRRPRAARTRSTPTWTSTPAARSSAAPRSRPSPPAAATAAA